MKETAYATAVARIRSNENALLTNEDIERLITAKSAEQALSAAKDADTNRQPAVDDGFVQVWSLIREIEPEKGEFDFLIVKNDFHNLKAILKGVISGREFAPLLISPFTVDTAYIEACVREQSWDKLPAFMAQAAGAAYDCFVKTHDGQRSDMVIDRAALKAISDMSKDNDSDFIRGLGRLIVATHELRVAVRAGKLGFRAESIAECLYGGAGLDTAALAAAAASGDAGEYIGKTPYYEAAEALSVSVAEFEKWCDNALIEYIDKAKYDSLGPAPIASYIIKKEAEIKTVRIIVMSKSAGVSADEIRKRIRKVY